MRHVPRRRLRGGVWPEQNRRGRSLLPRWSAAKLSRRCKPVLRSAIRLPAPSAAESACSTDAITNGRGRCLVLLGGAALNKLPTPNVCRSSNSQGARATCSDLGKRQSLGLGSFCRWRPRLPRFTRHLPRNLDVIRRRLSHSIVTLALGAHWSRGAEALWRSGRQRSPDRARSLWGPARSRTWRHAAFTGPHSAVRPP